jgi:PAS domain S-box-containing protein
MDIESALRSLNLNTISPGVVAALTHGTSTHDTSTHDTSTHDTSTMTGWKIPPLILRQAVWRYGLAVVSVGVALLVTRSFGRGFDIRGALFLTAVALTAWFGGIGPGLAASVLSLLSLGYFFPPLVPYVEIAGLRVPYRVVSLTFFAALALIVCWLSTSRRRVEEALRESEQRWRSLTEALPQLVWGAGPDGACNYFSTQWTTYTGIPETALLGWAWMETLHPDDRGPIRQFWTESVAGRQPYDVEYRIRRSDGTYGWFKTRGTPIRDSDGTIVKWFGTCTDITDRKRAEQTLKDHELELNQARDLLEIKVMERTKELRRSEAYLEEAQKLSKTGSWARVSATGKIKYWSEECYRVLGFEPRDGLPRFETFLQHVHPDDQHRVKETAEKAERAKVDYEVDYRIVRPGGDIRDIHTIGHPVLSPSGEVVEFVGTVMDITERRQAEKERERLRQVQADLAHINRTTTMGELTASLAHEINQPIAAAVTDAKTCLRWLAREQPDLAEARESATRMVKAVTRASEIITRLRQLFKKGAPQTNLVDVGEVIQEMVVLLRSEASRHSVSILADLSADLPPVMADRVQLQQVLMNLMLNGIEAMHDTKSGGQLEIRSVRGENGQLLISVSDTGVGLPAEQADQIFNAFFSTKAQGTGMGLSISRSIIESHGGRLWATSNPNRGATFSFTLPTAEAQE